MTESQDLQKEVQAALQRTYSKEELVEHERQWLGKEGKIKIALKGLRDLSPEERVSVASQLNEWKASLEQFFEAQRKELGNREREEKLKKETFDFSLPGIYSGVGRLHPVTLVERKVTTLLRQFGFEIVEGPIVEKEYYCFDALSIPPHHPARDLQDTFFTEQEGFLLRTQTTSIQARSLHTRELPLKIIAPGVVYRNEAEDPTHTSMFHQYELVWIEKGITFSHLLGVIQYILKELYGKRRKIRFVPKFYPYTEPSIGPQVECGFCKGEGCSGCGGQGWATVGGAGMVHQSVLKEFNKWDGEISGFAFGLGTIRLAAQMVGVSDLRDLYGNDLAILEGDKI